MRTKESYFTQSLINWYSIVKRDLPWRQTKDPYRIWLSEIILQQTRVDQGLPYYERFVEKYPTVKDLARASEQEVLKLWEGLGYYSRARNLLVTAQQITTEHDGIFPGNYAGLLQLKGIGPYTAAAISSIAYREAVPVIDGNVFRFISRHFGIEKEIAESKNRKYFDEVLRELIPADDPGAFNQAVMEFGATICKPAPLCEGCRFRQSCFAFAHNKQRLLPVKKAKVKVKERFITYLVFEFDGYTLMRPRKSSIWTGLFEFANLERDTEIALLEVEEVLGNSSYEIFSVSPRIRHLLSHRRLWVTFCHIRLREEEDFSAFAKVLGLTRFSWEEVLTLPRPKVIVNHLQDGLF